MLRDIALISLVLRVLVFSYFITISIGKPPTKQALIIIPSVIYLLVSMYNFLYPGKLKIFKSYGDLIFIPILAFLSGQKESFLTFLPFISLNTSRKIFQGTLFLWLSIIFSLYHYGKVGLTILPLLIGIYIASIHPDLIEALRKERFYIKNLRKAYHKMISDYGRLEKELSSIKMYASLLDKIEESSSLEHYLRSIKEEFNLKVIRIVPIYEDSSKEIDPSTYSFHVPIELEKGKAKVSFYFNNPLELYDKELLKNLEKASKLINLYIEGFEEKSKAKVIAV
ncbi:MAG: hypothetical protein P3W89_007940 [Aquificaceae bacterium]|nr:hypothetical protein [Aquificaceae bacterium]